MITGTANNVQEAKGGLLEKVAELEKEKEDKAARSFEIKLEVNPEYHPKIIGRRGAVIQELRKNYEVNVQLPKKGDPNEHIITITGYAYIQKVSISKINRNQNDDTFLCLDIQTFFVRVKIVI